MDWGVDTTPTHEINLDLGAPEQGGPAEEAQQFAGPGAIPNDTGSSLCYTSLPLLRILSIDREPIPQPSWIMAAIPAAGLERPDTHK